MLTQARLKELIRYDFTTGHFYWRSIRKGVSSTTIPAGCVNKLGYVVISFDNKRLLAHRLAWLYWHGMWPKDRIDHINGNTADNRLINLRDVSHSVNMQNQRKPHVDSFTGFMGVTFNKDRKLYAAKINANGKTKLIGRFKTAEEAHSAYLIAKRKLHEGCLI